MWLTRKTAMSVAGVRPFEFAGLASGGEITTAAAGLKLLPTSVI
jgi:hypothetical protein